MAPVETHYYELLGVTPEATDADLKKGYRKQAMIYHPDKNSAPEAEEKFKEISLQLLELKLQNLRTVYDKYGQSMAEKEGGGVKMEDAAAFFSMMFGGERFVDYIGEISFMKEMTDMATTMMTEEEKDELEKEMGSEVPSTTVKETAEGTSTPSKPTDAPGEAQPTTTSSAQHEESPGLSPPKPPTTQTSSVSVHGTNASPADTPTSETPPSKASKKKQRLTPEQREKLEKLDKERREAMEQRITLVTSKLKDRLRPFVEAKHPGEKSDPETKAFEDKIRREAEDLKLESFGVELLHTIGSIYMMKATSFLKSKKFLGISGFFSRLKEKGSLAKDAMNVIGSALGVQSLMMEIERLQAKGELSEEQQLALDKDMTGKILLASWRGTRFEVVNVLRDAVDNVLKDKEVSDEVLYNRAKGLLFIGAIFKSTQPDEEDEERREMERLVAYASKGKSHHQQYVSEQRAAARATAKTAKTVKTP